MSNPDLCPCPDCKDSEEGPCAMDCDVDDECAGCRDARMDDQELREINAPHLIH